MATSFAAWWWPSDLGPDIFNVLLDFVGDESFNLLSTCKAMCVAMCGRKVSAHAIIGAMLSYCMYGTLAPAQLVAQLIPGVNGKACGPDVHLLTGDYDMAERLIGRINHNDKYNRENKGYELDSNAVAYLDGVFQVREAFECAPLPNDPDLILVPRYYSTVDVVTHFLSRFEATTVNFPATIIDALHENEVVPTHGDLTSLLIANDENGSGYSPFVEGVVEYRADLGSMGRIQNSSRLETLMALLTAPEDDGETEVDDEAKVDEKEEKREFQTISDLDHVYGLRVIYAGGPDDFHSARTLYLAEARALARDISMDPDVSMHELQKAMILDISPDESGEEAEIGVVLERLQRAQVREVRRLEYNDQELEIARADAVKKSAMAPISGANYARVCMPFVSA